MLHVIHRDVSVLLLNCQLNRLGLPRRKGCRAVPIDAKHTTDDITSLLEGASFMLHDKVNGRGGLATSIAVAVASLVGTVIIQGKRRMLIIVPRTEGELNTSSLDYRAVMSSESGKRHGVESRRVVMYVLISCLHRDFVEDKTILYFHRRRE